MKCLCKVVFRSFVYATLLFLSVKVREPTSTGSKKSRDGDEFWKDLLIDLKISQGKLQKILQLLSKGTLIVPRYILMLGHVDW